MLSVLNPQQFDDVYAILQDSFPTDERRPYAQQKALLSRQDYAIYGMFDENAQDIKGFMAVYELQTLVFLEHFAVSERYRNQGLGAVMLDELLKQTVKPVFLEVELPHTDMAQRRIAFYKRNGFYLHDYPYEQPPLAPNQHPVELRLMSSQKQLTPSAFAKVKQQLYKTVYQYEETR